ncbi:MAG: universal stress protein [Thermodesulfobacteriota bacterium]
MSEIKKILAPIDFSSNAEKVADFACEKAHEMGAALTFMNVVDDTGFHHGFSVQDSVLRDVRDRMEKKANEYIEEHKKFCKVCDEAKVIVGDTVEEIVKAAQEGSYDMIIIGTHGYKGIEKIFLGSVAERVIKRAPCPVLVFNPNR